MLIPSGYLRDCCATLRALLSDKNCHCTVPKFPVYINRHEIVFTGAAIVKDLFLSWVVCQKGDSAPQETSNGSSLEGFTQCLACL